MELKLCRDCKTLKLGTEFYIHRNKTTSNICKSCKSIYDKQQYIKTADQRNARKRLLRKQNPAKYAYAGLIQRGRAIAPKEDFMLWYEAEPKVCHYCDLPEGEPRHEIDRKDSTLGYTIDNIVFACKACNIAKFNIWDYDTFKTYIGPAIKQARESKKEA